MSMRLLSAILLALIAALSITSAIVAAFPVDMAYRLIWAGVSFPVVWTLLIFYAYWAERAARPVIFLVILTTISIAAVLSR